MNRFLFWNLKGGVGKTFLAAHYFLWARYHRRFCFLDADEQSTAMKWISGNRYDGSGLIRVDADSGQGGSVATSDLGRAAGFERLIIDGSPRSDFLEALTDQIDLEEGWRAVVPVGERYGLEGAQEAIPKIRQQGGRPMLVVNDTDTTTAIGRRIVAQARELATRLEADLHRRVISFSKVIRQAADKGVPAWEVGWSYNSHAVLALNLLCHELLFGESTDGAEYDYTAYQRKRMNELRVDHVLS